MVHTYKLPFKQQFQWKYTSTCVNHALKEWYFQSPTYTFVMGEAVCFILEKVQLAEGRAEVCQTLNCLTFGPL